MKRILKERLVNEILFRLPVWHTVYAEHFYKTKVNQRSNKNTNGLKMFLTKKVNLQTSRFQRLHAYLMN